MTTNEPLAPNKECPKLPAQKERPQVPHLEQDDTAGRGRTASDVQGEQVGMKKARH